jgi:hypothetical protein
MGKFSRNKGSREELALVHALQRAGLAAEKTPLSGAAGGRSAGDVSVPLLGVDRRIEVKIRADGFREIYKWLGGNDLLVIRANRKEPLVVLSLKFAVEIAAIAEKNR